MRFIADPRMITDACDTMVAEQLKAAHDLPAATAGIRDALTQQRDGESVDDETFMLVRRAESS